MVILTSDMVDSNLNPAYQQMNEIIVHTVPQDSHGTFAMLKATVMLRNRVKAGDGSALTAIEVPNNLQCNLLNALLRQLLQ